MARKKSKDMTHCSELNQMRLEGALCDAVLRVDKVDFKVHRIILSSYSLYFRTLFSSKSSLDEAVYIIADVSSGIMDLIINYIYTQDIQITSDNVLALLITADYLQIKGLVCSCCKFVEANLNVDNCLVIWQATKALVLCNELWHQVYTYVLHHFEDVIQSPSSGFLELTAAQLGSILEEDELNVKQEKTVLQAIIKWMEHEPDVRTPQIVDLLPKVRLAVIDLDYLPQDVIKNPVVSQFLECQQNLTQIMLYHINMSGLNTRNLFARPRLPYSILFTMCGFNRTGPTSTIEVYNSKCDIWTCVSRARSIFRYQHGTVFLDGFLYFIGGFNKMHITNTMHKFNPRYRTWTEVAPMHAQRAFLSVAVLDGYIYAIGGCNETMLYAIEWYKTAERYDPSTNQWSFIPSMYEPRGEAGATTLNGKIYICGGAHGHNSLSSAECFDPRANQWTLIQMMNMPRKGLGVIALNNQVFAIGGANGDGFLQSIEAYDPYTNSWRRLSPMIHPRKNFGIEVMDGCLYVVGGMNREGIMSSCERYDVNSNNWFTIQNMNISRKGLTCCVVSGLPNVFDYIM